MSHLPLIHFRRWPKTRIKPIYLLARAGLEKAREVCRAWQEVGGGGPCLARVGLREGQQLDNGTAASEGQGPRGASRTFLCYFLPIPGHWPRWKWSWVTSLHDSGGRFGQAHGLWNGSLKVKTLAAKTAGLSWDFILKVSLYVLKPPHIQILFPWKEPSIDLPQFLWLHFDQS